MDKTKEKYVLENEGLAHFVARRFNNTGYDYCDLLQTGMIGLIKAANNFDAERGAKFASYAVPAITNEILMLLREERKSCRCDISIDAPFRVNGNDKKPVSLVEIIPDDIVVDEGIMQECDVFLLKEGMKTLSEKEFETVALLYGIGREKHTQPEVAAILGHSQSYISRINRAALKKLRKYITSRW